MIHRIELKLKDHLEDPLGSKVMRQIKTYLHQEVRKVRTLEIFQFETVGHTHQELDDLCKQVLLDPVLHEYLVDDFFIRQVEFDWYVEVGFKAGVTDNVGRTARENFNQVLRPTLPAESAVYFSRGYLISGDLKRDLVEHIADDLLRNPLIERCEIFPKNVPEEIYDRLKRLPLVQINDRVHCQKFRFSSVDELMQLSRERTLALSEIECQTILDYYKQPAVQRQRKAEGLDELPTDVELEVIAQTWSEHCKHKIFNAEIDYLDTTTGQRETIRSLYKTYIQKSTKEIRASLGENDWCVSVFTDNAGVVRFNDQYNVAMKVETHNSPSALDPYGGALTGIVGVNRDIMGTGMGAAMIFNTDVFCFASPFYDQPLPPRLMHPRRIYEGVRLGVEHGGNKSGIPTVNGCVVFHERFLGKPLVFCGTGGLMPREVNGQPSHEKTVEPGDYIVMTGGRIGKDGIHGATFSSEALTESSPATAVQIGDPIVQKRMADFLLEARDRGLYRCITDNGAGGLSSSVGEMATFCNGAHLNLERAPLKYKGLQAWEIFVSEAQERMTLAVPPEHWDDFHHLAEAMGVEATQLGTFNQSGFLSASYKGELTAMLEMEFLHKGLPDMQLKAVWTPPTLSEPNLTDDLDLSDLLLRLLKRLNICSKESMVRQYDHEVQGGSVVKPLVGILNDGPSDAAVITPVLGSMEGLAISNGICPRYSDLDTYHMMACAIDEAVRNIISVGGSLKQIAGLDNFCWCDPVQSANNPDGQYKLAQLVRANQALYDLTTLYGVPCISGKDSMKNDYRHGEVKISIPPTVLFSAMGKIEDVRKAVTMDAKQAGDLIYLLGSTRDELGGSELYAELGEVGANVPKVQAEASKALYQTLSQATERQLLASCHDCSDGGLAVALAETLFSGGLGGTVDLHQPMSEQSLNALQMLFSESPGRFVVTVHPDNRSAFETLLQPHVCYFLGQVQDSAHLVVQNQSILLLQSSIHDLKAAWQETLKDLG